MFENVKQTSLLLCIFAVALVYLAHIPRSTTVNLDFVPIGHSHADINRALELCDALNAPSNTIKDFSDRKGSDRYEHGTNATLIRNAVIWTGRDNGTEILRGSLLLDNGIVWRLGSAYEHLIRDDDDVTIIDANGGWVTPGLGELFRSRVCVLLKALQYSGYSLACRNHEFSVHVRYKLSHLLCVCTILRCWQERTMLPPLMALSYHGCGQSTDSTPMMNPSALPWLGE